MYKVDYKYMMDLDLFIRMYKDRTLQSKFINVCVITFRTGGASSSAADKLESERKKMIKDNGGSEFDVFSYIIYHRCKYFIKVLVNSIRAWIRK